LTATLAHEGGIVFVKPITAIANATQQAAATTLGVELSAQLRAERAMRDAGLLADAPAASYLLLTSGPGGGGGPGPSPTDVASPSPTPSSGGPGPSSPVPSASASPGGPQATSSGGPGPAPNGAHASASPGGGSTPHHAGSPAPLPTPWFADDHPGGSGGEPRARVHEEERWQADDARTAWMGLSGDARKHAEALHGDRERALRDRVASQLARKALVFQRAGADQTATALTGKTVTTTFNVAGSHGGAGRTLTVTRTYDAEGSLVQSVETLVGNMDGIGFDCERARTLRPDGTEAIAMDVRLTIDGKVHTVRWAREVAADGTPSGTGSIVRPDGTQVPLTATAGADLQETISGKDAGAGVAMQVLADATKSTATATLDAGSAGSAELQIDVDQLPAN
jgi:hypothetical protein